MKYKIDYEGLKAYLQALTSEDFIEQIKITKGHAMDDIEFFKKDKSKIALNQVIDYGTPFMTDALGGDLSILVLSKRKYKLPTGRVVTSKFDRSIIEDVVKTFNGYSSIGHYWMIPEQFITYLK